jgi:hypothetical protein
MKFTIALLAALLLTGSAFAQQKEVRVALVIGNSAYKQSPLRNPANDARDMAVKLRSLGFTVIERSNLGIRQIGSTLREFRAKLTPGSVALVFYAGHGLQIKGENYLPAVDAETTGWSAGSATAKAALESAIAGLTAQGVEVVRRSAVMPGWNSSRQPCCG